MFYYYTPHVQLARSIFQFGPMDAGWENTLLRYFEATQTRRYVNNEQRAVSHKRSIEQKIDADNRNIETNQRKDNWRIIEGNECTAKKKVKTLCYQRTYVFRQGKRMHENIEAYIVKHNANIHTQRYDNVSCTIRIFAGKHCAVEANSTACLRS